MTLLELYKSLSNNPLFFNNYFSTSGKSAGKIFSFKNTNYRGILTFSKGELQGFAKGFKVLENVEGIKRSNWVRRVGHQETEKQHVVNMRKSELFRVVDDAYQKTSRGIVFKKMVDDEHLSVEEKKLICLFLILAGYFSDIPNYIIEQTKIFFERCNEVGYTDEEVLDAQKSFIKNGLKSKNIYEIFLEPYLYMDSFYSSFDGIDFLKAYKDAPEHERLEFVNYISSKYKHKTYDCVITRKYEPGGNYTKKTTIDNAFILFVVKKIITANNVNFDAFVSTMINSYSELYSIDEKRIKKFIYDTNKNRSVFQVIFCKVMNVPISPLMVEKDLSDIEIRELSLSDATDEEGAIALDIVSSSLKKLAKLNTGYKCVLEECEMCKYFTAKENNKNYLEIHHLIPREFANDFDAPIEILDNYIALCPNCHRKIHLAVDAERKYMINTLFNQRKDKLSEHGLSVDIKTLYNYYKIDDKN